MGPQSTNDFLDANCPVGERGQEICKRTLLVIRNEKPNFECLGQRRPYNSLLHKKAVTEYSFECLYKAMSNLSYVLLFHLYANEVGHLCKEQLNLHPDNRQSAQILGVVKKLEPLLEEQCGP